MLATPAPPRQIHAGLLLTGAEPGHPVRFLPKFVPPAGTPIAIELHWTEEGKPRPRRRPRMDQGRTGGHRP